VSGIPFSNSAIGVPRQEVKREANYNIHVWLDIDFLLEFQYGNRRMLKRTFLRPR